ncbi:MAG: AAA family ATPase, partial [Ktedonobacteraceae bacterium]
MITSLQLQNFKCFENQVLAFKPLTLLSGLNGTGKSSVIQSLLLLRQSYQQGLLENGRLALNGDLIHIGTAQDALYEGAKDNKIGFGLSLGGSEHEPHWIFEYDGVADVLKRVPWKPDGDVAITAYHSTLFNENFHYLQAER